MKGDRVEIVIDAGGEGTRTYEVAASRAGRRVEIATRRGVVEVSEVTRTGTPSARPASWRAVSWPWWSTPWPPTAANRPADRRQTVPAGRARPVR